MTEVLQDRPASTASDAPAPAPGAVSGAAAAPAWTSRRVLLLAAAAIAVQLMVRGWMALTGALSQDDLVVAARSARLPLLSTDFLLPAADRFAPLAHLVTGAITRAAPLEYWPMAVVLVALQALASLAMLRLLRLLLGDRPALLLPLLLFLFSPLMLAAFDSWSTAVGALPLQAGLAWVCGDALKLHATGRRRYALTGTLAFVTALLFGEKAVVIPLVALTVLALVVRQAGEPSPIVAALRRGAWLWAGLAGTTVAVVWPFWSAVRPAVVAAERSGSLADGVDAVGASVFDGILPALVGGPLAWSEIGTWADPPVPMVAATVAIALVAISWVSWRRRGCGVIWALLAAYTGASVLFLVVGRLTTGVAAQFALSLRYFPDVLVVAVIALALVARAPARAAGRDGLLDRRERRDVAVLMAVFFVGLSLWSTVTYTQTRDSAAIREYLATAGRSLQTAGVPVLDQPVPATVVWGAAAPDNRVSRVFAPLGVETASTTPELLLLAPTGELVEGRVSEDYALLPGPAECGHFVEQPSATGMLLNGAVPDGEWLVQLNYLASLGGSIEVSFQNGEPLRVPVSRGLDRVYLTLRGSGEHLTVTSGTPGLAVCIDTGLVGVLERAD